MDSCRMAAAVDSPSSSPLGGRSQPAENGHAFTSGAYPFPSFFPTSPSGTAGAAHITPNNAAFPGAAAGMTPGKAAAQTPRRPHRTSKTRSPVAVNPPPSSSAFGTPEGEPSSGTSWPGLSAESAKAAAAETAERVLPQRFAQSVNLGARDWPPSEKPPPPTGLSAAFLPPVLTCVAHLCLPRLSKTAM